MDIWIVTIIIICTLYLLISEKIPMDLTAIAIMVALMVSGILTPGEAVAGFSNPAVITVGAMFLISRSMVRTGAVSAIGDKVLDWAGGRTWAAMLLVLVMVAAASAFINNTPVVVLFIPVVMGLGCRLGISFPEIYEMQARAILEAARLVFDSRNALGKIARQDPKVFRI